MTQQHASIAAVKRFFFAVTIQDGAALWEEMSEQARAYVLNLAVQQGMDFELGSRLRTDTAGEEEWAQYLHNLVLGVGRDLDGIDLANLLYRTEPAADRRVRVHYSIPLGLTSSSGQASIPAGSALVIEESGRCKVDRLIPRPGR